MMVSRKCERDLNFKNMRLICLPKMTTAVKWPIGCVPVGAHLAHSCNVRALGAMSKIEMAHSHIFFESVLLQADLFEIVSKPSA